MSEGPAVRWRGACGGDATTAATRPVHRCTYPEVDLGDATADPALPCALAPTADPPEPATVPADPDDTTTVEHPLVAADGPYTAELVGDHRCQLAAPLWAIVIVLSLIAGIWMAAAWTALSAAASRDRACRPAPDGVHAAAGR